MSYINNVLDIKNVCRICLTRSDNLIPLDSKLDNKLDDDSPAIADALENIFSVKVIYKEKYPGQVCVMCYGHIKISYDLKLIYNKSQEILKKYISLWDRNLQNKITSTVESYLIDSADCIQEDYTSFSDTSTNYDSDSIKSDCKPIDNSIDPNKKTVILKLENTTEENKNIKVKWLEGNKFIIERNRNILKEFVSCIACNAKFASKERLTEHQNVCKQSILKSVKCDFCSHKFSSLNRKNYHVKMKHNISTTNECKICNKSFKNPRTLAYHNTTQHNSEGKTFVCKICGKGFYLKNGLSQHMDIHSRDVSKVVCPVCGKGFHYRGGLFYHMKMHRNERNYSCNYCNRKFLNISGLKKHIRTHTGERPYTCTFCGRTFLSKNILDNHEKTHTGVKNKFCPHCGKGFITAYSLKVHISSHSGSEPCEFCNRSFLNSEVLKLHVKFKHSIKKQ